MRLIVNFAVKLRIMKYVKFWLQFIINQLKYLFTINCIILRVHQHQSQIFKVLKSDYIYYTLTSYCPKEVICQNAIDRFSKGYFIFLPAGYTSPVGGGIYQCSRSAIKHRRRRRRRPITVTLFWSLWFQRYCNLFQTFESCLLFSCFAPSQSCQFIMVRFSLSFCQRLRM